MQHLQNLLNVNCALYLVDDDALLKGQLVFGVAAQARQLPGGRLGLDT